MSDLTAKSHPRRAVEVLTKQNYERWFRQMQQWLIGEGLWLVVDPTNAPAIPPTRSTLNAVAAYGLDMGGSGPNPITPAAAKQMDAKARYQIGNCIDEDDEEMIAEEITARDTWAKLIKKYKKNLQTTGRQYLAELVNYKKPENMDIEATYTEITKRSRKVAELQPDMKVMATPARRFQTLLQSLPQEYTTIRDAIDAQKDMDIETSMQKLQEKEAQLKADKEGETAMLARDNKRKDDRPSRSAYRIPQRRLTDSSERSDPHVTVRRNDDRSTFQRKGCFLCDGPHRISDCELLRKLRKLAKHISKAKTNKDSKFIKTKARAKAYNANDEASSSSSDEHTPEIDSEDEEDMEELAAISKELGL